MNNIVKNVEPTEIGNYDLNTSNISNIYDEMIKVIEVTKGVESPITYISIYAMCESMIENMRSHIFKNRKDLDDEALMNIYSKFLTLYNCFDMKIVKEGAKMIEFYKPAKKASK